MSPARTCNLKRQSPGLDAGKGAEKESKSGEGARLSARGDAASDEDGERARGEQLGCASRKRERGSEEEEEQEECVREGVLDAGRADAAAQTGLSHAPSAAHARTHSRAKRELKMEGEREVHGGSGSSHRSVAGSSRPEVGVEAGRGGGVESAEEVREMAAKLEQGAACPCTYGHI